MAAWPPILVRRALAHIRRSAENREYGSEVGILRMQGQLTDTDVEAALLIGRIYGWMERRHGKRRTLRSPAYDIGAAGGTNPIHDDTQEATGAWLELCKVMLLSPRWLVDFVEELCVEDIHVPAIHLDEIRAVLGDVAQHYRLTPEARADRTKTRRQQQGQRAHVWRGDAARPIFDAELRAKAAVDRAATIAKLERRQAAAAALAEQRRAG